MKTTIEDQVREAEIQAYSYPQDHPLQVMWEAKAEALRTRAEQPVELHRREWQPLHPKRRRRKT